MIYTIDNKVDVDSIPKNVKDLITNLDYLILREIEVNTSKGKKSRISEIAEWEINPAFYKAKEAPKAAGREKEFLDRIKPDVLERNDYFYLPGKILHIDSDQEYLNRCLKYYENINIWAVGILEKEENISSRIYELLNEYNPNIVVITGHDAYYRKKGDINNLDNYKNSKYYVEAVREARKFENSHQKLIVIAGGCQSNYEELIKAGANFASSPKRVNIHALDPAIIATKMSLSDITEDINLKEILENTKYGCNGIGGIKTKGTMYVGYPR